MMYLWYYILSVAIIFLLGMILLIFKTNKVGLIDIWWVFVISLLKEVLVVFFLSLGLWALIKKAFR